MTTTEPFSSKDSRLFVAGFARGYRAWSVLPALDLSLRSLSYVYSWLPGRNLAQCMNVETYRQMATPDARGNWNCCGSCAEGARERLALLEGHRIPSVNFGPCNTCGFYAIHYPDFMGLDKYLIQGSVVYGSIKATGNVVIGERGFRSQIAEVEALAGPGAKASAAHYNVPWYPTLDELSVEYPPQAAIVAAPTKPLDHTLSPGN